MSWGDAYPIPSTPTPAFRHPSRRSEPCPGLTLPLIPPESPARPNHSAPPPVTSFQDQLESTLTILADFYADFAFQAKAETEYWRQANERLAGIQEELAELRVEAMEWRDEVVRLVEKKVGEWAKNTLKPTIVWNVLAGATGSGTMGMESSPQREEGAGREGGSTILAEHPMRARSDYDTPVIGSEQGSIEPVWTLPPLLDPVDWSFMALAEEDGFGRASPSIRQQSGAKRHS